MFWASFGKIQKKFFTFPKSCLILRVYCVTWILFLSGQKYRVSIPQEKTCDNIPDCISCTKIQNCKSPGANRCDECNCSSSTHFYCSSGKPLFVERTKVEDGKNDCSDGSDECPPSFLSNDPLSSKDELMKSVYLHIFVWIMTLMPNIGNIGVAVTTSKTSTRIINSHPTQILQHAFD